LAKRHELSVLSLFDPSQDVSSSIRATETYCRKVVAVPNDNCALDTTRKRLLQARSLLSPRSFESFVFRIPALQRALQDLVSTEPYDVICFEFTQMATNRP